MLKSPDPGFNALAYLYQEAINPISPPDHPVSPKITEEWNKAMSTAQPDYLEEMREFAKEHEANQQNCWGTPYSPRPGVCPNCGRCPTCGRGGYFTYPWPWYQPSICYGTISYGTAL